MPASWNFVEARLEKVHVVRLVELQNEKLILLSKTKKLSFMTLTTFTSAQKNPEEANLIKFTFLSTQEYKNTVSFLDQACSGIEAVKDTMKLHVFFMNQKGSG